MKRKAVKSQWKQVELRANVSGSSSKDENGVCRRASQAEMHEMFDVTDRTLRGWAQIGLPTEKGPGGRTLYPIPSAGIWGACYKAMVATADRHGRGPTHLSVEQAEAWHLGNQLRDDPDYFVIVPLDWDHPMREAQLRRAAEGCEPPEWI